MNEHTESVTELGRIVFERANGWVEALDQLVELASIAVED